MPASLILILTCIYLFCFDSCWGYLLWKLKSQICKYFCARTKYFCRYVPTWVSTWPRTCTAAAWPGLGTVSSLGKLSESPLHILGTQAGPSQALENGLFNACKWLAQGSHTMEYSISEKVRFCFRYIVQGGNNYKRKQLHVDRWF